MTTTFPYQAGDYVRVVALPPEIDRYDPEVRDCLRGMLGRVLKVEEIDDQGSEPLLEINVYPDGSYRSGRARNRLPARGAHPTIVPAVRGRAEG